MKTIGRAYLIAYALDAFLSVAASFSPGLEPLSNIVSTVVIIFTLGVFILALLNRLTNRKLFIVLSGFYLLMTAFGFVLALALLARSGPEMAQRTNISIASLSEQFAWYGPTHWVLLALWTCLALYGLTQFKNEEKA